MSVIAEMCQNHNGDKVLLKEMVHSAIEAGADVIKFQLIFADMLSWRPRFDQGEIAQNGRVVSIQRPYTDEYTRLKKLEIPEDVFSDMVSICNSAGVTPMCTAFNIDSLQSVKDMGFKVLKIASYDCASYPMLSAANSLFDEIYISTGSTFNSEMEGAVKLIAPEKLKLLHCVTVYPTPLDLLNLKKIKYLKQYCGNVGFSDHSDTKDGVKAAVAARYFGAEFVERHFTILNHNETKDGVVSITAEQVSFLKDVFAQPADKTAEWLQAEFPDFEILYAELKQNLSEEELLNRDYYRGRFINKLSSGLEYSNNV